MLSVYAGTLGATTPVALKEAFGGAGGGAEEESAINEVIQECKVLHRLRHPNITQLYGLWRGYDPDLAAMRVFMVLEFCGGGTLAEAVDMRDSEVRVRHTCNMLCVGICVCVSWVFIWVRRWTRRPLV